MFAVLELFKLLGLPVGVPEFPLLEGCIVLSHSSGWVNVEQMRKELHHTYRASTHIKPDTYKHAMCASVF